MGFCGSRFPFNYARGLRVQNTVLYLFPSHWMFGPMLDEVAKSTVFLPVFSGFGQNHGFWPKISDFRSKVPYFRPMARAKMSKLTTFLDTLRPSTSYSENKVVRLWEWKLTVLGVKTVNFGQFWPKHPWLKGDFDENDRKSPKITENQWFSGFCVYVHPSMDGWVYPGLCVYVHPPWMGGCTRFLCVCPPLHGWVGVPTLGLYVHPSMDGCVYPPMDGCKNH